MNFNLQQISKFFLHSFKGRIIATIIILHAVLMGMIVIDMIHRQKNFMEKQLIQQSNDLSHSLSVNAGSWILSRDINGLTELIESISSDSNIKLAMFLDRNGRVLASSNESLFNVQLNDDTSLELLDHFRLFPTKTEHHILHQGLIDSISIVSVSNRPVGYARIILSTASLQDELDAISQKGLAYTLVAVLLGGFIAWLAVSRTTQHLTQLSVAADDIAAGNLDIRLPEQQGKDEISRLTYDFAKMAAALKKHEMERNFTQAELFAAKERALVTLQSIGDAVITTDINGHVDFLNPVAEKLTGWSNLEARALPLNEIFYIINEETRRPVENPVNKALQLNAVVGLANHTVLIRRDGREIHIEDSAAPIRDGAGNILGVVLVFHDVGEKRKLASQLSYQATHDSLTGLINRNEFERRLKIMLQEITDTRREHALLYIDLDQFKIVNDTCGHSAGDELLKQITSHLQVNMRDSDIFARLGGDEFGIILPNCPIEQAIRIANEILKSVSSFHFNWIDKSFTVGASIGLVSIMDGSGNLGSILSAADTACYAAKDKGRNRIQVYLPEDMEISRRHGEMHWVTRINKALELQQFRLRKQKIVPLNDRHGSRQHFEVLVYIQGEDNVPIPPGAFIPAAERYNLMVEIDRWVVSNSLKWLMQINPADHMMAINLSGQSITDDRFLDFLIGEISSSGVRADNLCFEITETAAITNLSKAGSFISAVKSMGCSFSLDDFGSGMSSFTYLKNLPVDFLKIDGSFVRNILTDPIDQAMVEAINKIGQVMNIHTIAEFVENEEIRQKLESIGIDYAQGYGISHPVPL